MTRASKREQTHDRILANAIALFRSRGVRRTKLSEVAHASEISPATLFNYFPTKGRLAEGWVRGEVDEALASRITDSADRDRSLRSAIRTACRDLAGSSAPEASLRLEAWREAGRAIGESRQRGRALIAGLLEEQKRERVRADVPPAELAEILVDALEGGLIAGLRETHESRASGPALEAALSQAIRSRVDLVFDGFRKRNERVTVPARRSPAKHPAASM